jgi:adenylate cyclase
VNGGTVSAFILEAHRVLGTTLNWLGEFTAARPHLEEAIAVYDQQQHRSLAFRYGTDPGMGARTYAALTLWVVGYPDVTPDLLPSRSAADNNHA